MQQILMVGLCLFGDSILLVQNESFEYLQRFGIRHG